MENTRGRTIELREALSKAAKVTVLDGGFMHEGTITKVNENEQTFHLKTVSIFTGGPCEMSFPYSASTRY